MKQMLCKSIWYTAKQLPWTQLCSPGKHANLISFPSKGHDHEAYKLRNTVRPSIYYPTPKNAVLLSNRKKRHRILPLWARHARLHLIKVQLKIRWVYSLCWRLPSYANMLIFCTQNNIWDSSAAMRTEGYLIVIHKHFVRSQICFNHWHLNKHERFHLQNGAHEEFVSHNVLWMN